MDREVDRMTGGTAVLRRALEGCNRRPEGVHKRGRPGGHCQLWRCRQRARGVQDAAGAGWRGRHGALSQQGRWTQPHDVVSPLITRRHVGYQKSRPDNTRNNRHTACPVERTSPAIFTDPLRTVRGRSLSFPLKKLAWPTNAGRRTRRRTSARPAARFRPRMPARR